MTSIHDKKIIVTGGAGFIGSNLVERLSTDNEVLVVDNLHTGDESNIGKAEKNGKVKFLKSDAKDIKKLDFKADYVFHLGIYSASPMYRNDPFLVSEVVAGMIGVLEYAKMHKSRVVFASTSSIYNSIEPPHREDIIPKVTDYYTEARIAAERISELYSKLEHLNVQAVRFFSVYGPHEEAKKNYANLVTQFYWDIKKGESPVIYGDGTQRRDFIHVNDLVEILLRSSELSGFNVLNGGTGKNYSLNEMLTMLNKYLGTNVNAKYIKMPISNYVMETLADTAKLKSTLSYTPKIDLQEGIKLITK
ncbi:MAG: NAD-dependent epimerase/dehydratase family protein [Thermoplasmataceae archaeon]